MATVGILALQGDVEAHARAARDLGHAARAVKTAADLAGTDALVLPGGESSTMLKLLRDEGLFEPLREACTSGRAVLGTCAGAILLARVVTNPEQASLGVLDIAVERNGYGRQRDSFITTLAPGPLGGGPLEAVFIRAPVIRAVGPEVEVVLAHDGRPVLVRRGAVWAATFHPELSGEGRVLEAVVRSASA